MEAVSLVYNETDESWLRRGVLEGLCVTETITVRLDSYGGSPELEDRVFQDCFG